MGFDYSSQFFTSGTGAINNNGFITPILLWEGYNDQNSRDSVKFVATSNLTAGSNVVLRSGNFSHPFDYALPVDMAPGDTLMVKDIISTKFFIATPDEIWMTKQAIRFDLDPEWFLISDDNHNGFEDTPQSLAISSDANYLFVGTTSGRLFRISNIALAYDYEHASVASSGCIIATDELVIAEGNSQIVTSVSVDPADPNNVLVTLGNYGHENYVYYSSDALSDNPTFNSKQGNLPQMPVYSSIIELKEATNEVLVGTEEGIWATSDITATECEWYFAAPGIGKVPVMAMKQQSVYKSGFTITLIDPATQLPIYEFYPEINNYGDIYAATHGRGIFRVDLDYVGYDDHFTKENSPGQLNIYPNPARSEIRISGQGTDEEALLNIYDFSGKLVFSQNINPGISSEREVKVNITTLKEGTYLVQMVAGTNIRSGKLVVIK
jgi:hypothetical protein